MRTLDFVVIGAMKSGTTTLYEDLRQHPDIFLLDKESSLLAGAREHEAPPADPAGRVGMALSGAPVNAVCGEVSTTYAMAPHFPGVVEAAADLPKAPRVVYILRDPVARIISHHHHDISSGRLTLPIDEAVRTDPRLVDYSRYAAQIRPWINLVGQDNVLLLRFEDYMSDRQTGLSHVLDFLGLAAPHSPIDARVYNRSEGKPVAVGYWGTLVRSGLYRRGLRPFLPEGLRRRTMAAVLPEAPARPAPPSPSTISLIEAELADDQRQLAEILGSEWWQVPRRGHDGA